MSNPITTLDVRADIRNGQEPFTKIMATVASLAFGEDLLLIAPFQPVPLFHVLAKRGFTHTERKNADGDWEVLFRRDSGNTNIENAPPQAEVNSCSCSVTKPSAVVELDARGLEPPQPLVAILEALSILPEGAELRAQTDRRPIHLYPQLEERGFTGQTEETENGSFITHIRRS